MDFTLADLHRRLAGISAVAACSTRSRFSCDAGEIVALLGPNGAGKSTLLSIAATLLDSVVWRGPLRRSHARASGAAAARAHRRPRPRPVHLSRATGGREPRVLRARSTASPTSTRGAAALERAGLATTATIRWPVLARHAAAARARARVAARAAAGAARRAVHRAGRCGDERASRDACAHLRDGWLHRARRDPRSRNDRRRLPIARVDPAARRRSAAIERGPGGRCAIAIEAGVRGVSVTAVFLRHRLAGGPRRIC